MGEEEKRNKEGWRKEEKGRVKKECRKEEGKLESNC